MHTSSTHQITDNRQRFEAVREAVPISSVVGTLQLSRCGRDWIARCPFHADRTPSFTIYEDDRRFKCFGCGAYGDVVDFVAKTAGIGLLEALKQLESGHATIPCRSRSVRDPSQGSDRRAEAVAVWHATIPAVDTPAEAYLRARGLSDVLPPSIRFARLPLGRHPSMPALIAAVASADGSIGGIQRIYLNADGATKANLPGGKCKFSLGRIRGGAIRLSPAGSTLVLAGGLEDALTLQQELGMPAWAATGEAMMGSVVLPPWVRNVIVAADNDAAGEIAARNAADIFALSGRKAKIIRPLAGFKDFNDQLRGLLS